MTQPPQQAPTSFGGTCPFCGLSYMGSPSVCTRCGTLLGEAAEDLKRLGETERRRVRSRKALADVFFLVGLLLGGPMMSLGGEMRLGLFVVLAGSIASVVRRYTRSSAPGSVIVGCLGAILVATTVIEPAEETVEEIAAGEAARTAYVSALSQQDREVLVETRGPGSLTVWFTVPAALSGVCGDYPDPEVRGHLASLGFLRVVVSDRSREGGLCSFRP